MPAIAKALASRVLPVATFIAALAGCASVDPAQRFAGVRETVGQRLNQNLTWSRDTQPSSAVREAFQRHGIIKFKADWTNADPAITKILKQFGRPGVPLYVLYPAGKAPIVFPELLTQSIMLEKLETITPHVAAE